MTTLIQKATNWGKSAFLGLAPEKTGVPPESGVRAIHFVHHDGGTATDTHTGLTWMRCAFGQTWDGRHCTGTAKPLAWDQVMALDHSFAGHNDWRVPNIDELQSLIAAARNYRNTYMSVFPNAPNAAHWSSSPSTKDSGLIQFVQLPSGSIGDSAKDNGYGRRVRLVRGWNTLISPTPPTSGDANSEINKSIEMVRIDAHAPKMPGQDVLGGNIQRAESKQPMSDPINCADINVVDGEGDPPLGHVAVNEQEEFVDHRQGVGAFSATDRFIDNLDGTATDTHTGLTWMRCALGQEWDGITCVAHANAYKWNEACALRYAFGGNNDWRLPTINELKSLVDLTRREPAIDIAVFPNSSSSTFWSASALVAGVEFLPNVAKATNFSNGSTRVCNQSNYFYVRLVRQGQPMNPIGSVTSNTYNGINSVVGHTPFATANTGQAADQTVPATIVDEVAYGSNGVASKSISDSNGNSIYEAKTQVTPEAILTSPQFQVPKFAYDQGAKPMVSVTTKHRDMDTPTQPSTQQVKANEVDVPQPFETVLERLNLLEARFDKFINRIEGALAPTSEDQSKTLDVINQLHLRSSVSAEKLSDELTQLRQSIDCNESRFDASFNRIETDLKSLFQGQVKMMEAITLLHEHSTSHTNTFSNEFAVLRQVLVVALQSANAPTQVTAQFTANPEPDVIAVGDMYMFLQWLVGQEAIPLSEFRIRLLPLDLLSSAVIDDINERALDLTGEMALLESGDSVEVQQSILKHVITAFGGQSVFISPTN